jgi:hypothetical protein
MPIQAVTVSPHQVKKLLRHTIGQFNLPLLLDEGKHLLVFCRQTSRSLHTEIGKLTCGGKRFCQFHSGDQNFLVKRHQFCSPLFVCWESLRLFRFCLLPVILKLAPFVPTGKQADVACSQRSTVLGLPENPCVCISR